MIASGNPRGVDSELMRLSSMQCDGTVTEADCRRLDKLLAEPAALACYMALMEQHATFLRQHRMRKGAAMPPLADDSRPRESGNPASRGLPSGSRRSQEQPVGRGRTAAMVALDGIRVLLGWLSRPETASFLIAGIFLAGVLGLVAIVSPLSGQADRDDAFSAGRLPVAFVSAVHKPAWPGDKPSFHAWQSLRVGEMIELTGGLAEISFVSGAKVVLEGPVRFEATARDGGLLHAGRMTVAVKANEAASAAETSLFTVTTPNAVITDLGTEFGVASAPTGDTLVQVFEGRVRLEAVVGVSAVPQQPLRLVAGHAAGVTADGQLTMRSPASFARFVRSLPKPNPESPSMPFLTRIGWEDAAAERLVHDPFNGTAPLAGSPPVDRSGTSDAAWIAPPQAWDLRAGLLHADSPGSALVPFRPEPGWLYRLTVTLDVVAGGEDWCAIGFRAGADPVADHISDGGFAWSLQRHSTATLGSHVFAGPGTTNKLTEGDRRTGRQTRSVVLDTTGPRWLAHFLLADEPVASYGYPSPPTEISHVGVSVYRTARARIDSLTLERAVKQTPGTRAADGPGRKDGDS